jgi:methyl coenzyme M reductase beta subunit
MKMGKRTMAALGAVLMTVLAAGAATAAQPLRESLFYEDDVLTLCSFPVLAEFTANKE